MITLVLGGRRSGKSTWAEEYARSLYPQAEGYYYLATGVACDAEMVRRIALHQEKRGGLYCTVEEPYDLARALRNLPCEAKVVLVECLTTWLGNLFYRGNLCSGQPLSSALRERNLALIERSIAEFLEALEDFAGEVILVSNELGWGVIPSEWEARLFRAWQGRLNQRVAQLAQRVVLVVAGLPLPLKGSLPERA